MPLLLLFILGGRPSAAMTRAAGAAGWRTEAVTSFSTARTLLQTGEPSLLLLSCAGPARLARAVSRVRAYGGLASLLPILGNLPNATPFDKAPPGPGLDGMISDAGSLRHALDRWRPLATPHPGPRLARAFDAAEVSGLLDRFCAMLASVLARSDPAGFDLATAHQIAGLAGTLGLTELGDAWRSLSSGNRDATERARHVSRKTLLLLNKNAWPERNNPQD